MKRISAILQLGSLLLSGIGPPALGAGATNELAAEVPGARADFEAFRLIAERNIFNPNRSARGDSERSTRKDPERRVRTDSFALLGTMSYEKGRFAFFDGSSSDYRKVLQATGSIAGFKVTAVAPTCVRLQGTNGEMLELCVGQRMSRAEEEDWRLNEKPGTTEPASAGSASASSGESEDALKRLMQRRQEEGAPTTVEISPPPPALSEKKAVAEAGESDDALKRLLQKREQELNK